MQCKFTGCKIAFATYTRVEMDSNGRKRARSVVNRKQRAATFPISTRTFRCLVLIAYAKPPRSYAAEPIKARSVVSRTASGDAA